MTGHLGDHSRRATQDSGHWPTPGHRESEQRRGDKGISGQKKDQNDHDAFHNKGFVRSTQERCRSGHSTPGSVKLLIWENKYFGPLIDANG
jgi:hypothetical protein